MPYGFGWYGRGGYGWPLFGFGRGRWLGRGRGWGAVLGYCPWTGLPRGWRWWYAPYWSWATTPTQSPYWRTVAPYGFPWYMMTPAVAGIGGDERAALEEEMRALEQRLAEIEARLKELKR